MNIQQFAKENSWENKMNKSQGLDSWNNYSGPNLGDWVVVLGRNRDSEILDNSNFDCALERLGGEGKHVKVERFGHWGCGWFELILVNPKSKSKLQIAFDIKQDLKKYPVLDESDFSEREFEYQSNYAEQAQEDLAEALKVHFGIARLTKIAYELNIECQMYYGNDCCINIYKNRKPDAGDIEQLKTCLKQMTYQGNKWENKRLFQKLVKAVEAYQVQ